MNIYSLPINIGGKLMWSIPNEWQPKIDDIKFVLMTNERQHNYSLTDAHFIVDNSDFNTNWKTVIFSVGWNVTFHDNPQIRGIRDAYLCRGNVNFIVRFFYKICFKNNINNKGLFVARRL